MTHARECYVDIPIATRRASRTSPALVRRRLVARGRRAARAAGARARARDRAPACMLHAHAIANWPPQPLANWPQPLARAPPPGGMCP